MSSLEKSILSIIVYYDIFDYPLTLVEIARMSDIKCRILDVRVALDNLKDKIESYRGFYFLKQRGDLVKIRQKRRNYGVKKWKRALRAVRVLRFIPYIRMIALCNNNSYLNTKKDSDIDLFIIVRKNNIWLARFLITFLTQILGIRRHGKKIKNRLCLSFYITDEAMNLRKFYDKNNIYLYQWINLIAPIFDVGTYENFFKANNWIKEFIPQANVWKTAGSVVVKDSGFNRNFRNFFEKILDNSFGRVLNLGLKKIQLKKMLANKNSAIHEDNDKVIVNDFMMKFHEKELPDYRPESFVAEGMNEYGNLRM